MLSFVFAQVTGRAPFPSGPCATINTQWLELPMSRTNFHGTKDVCAFEVRLYTRSNKQNKNLLHYITLLKQYYMGDMGICNGVCKKQYSDAIGQLIGII